MSVRFVRFGGGGKSGDVRGEVKVSVRGNFFVFLFN